MTKKLDIGVELQEVKNIPVYEVLIQRKSMSPIRFLCSIEDGIVKFASTDLEITTERFVHYLLAELGSVFSQSVTISVVKE